MSIKLKQLDPGESMPPRPGHVAIFRDHTGAIVAKERDGTVRPATEEELARIRALGELRE